MTPKRTTGYIGYWFFRQRTDRSSTGDIHVSNGREEKILTYHQNTVLILDIDSSFVVKTRNNPLPNRPFCEIYFSKETNSIIDHMIK